MQPATDRSLYYQSVERNRGGISSPRRLGLDHHTTLGGLTAMPYQNIGRHPPFTPPKDVFYDTKSAGITHSPQRGIGSGAMKGLSERTAALLSQAAQGVRNPHVEVLSIDRNIASTTTAAPATADVGISTKSTTMTPPVKMLSAHSRSLSILSMNRYPSVSVADFLQGELVQVQRSGFWLDARVQNVCIDGYNCKICPLPPLHPLSSSPSLYSTQRYSAPYNIRRATNKIEKGEYCKYAPKELYVQVQQIDYGSGEAQVRVCSLGNSGAGLRKFNIKDLRKEPKIEIGDFVKAWQVETQTWKTCSVVGIGDEGYRCSNWRVYPRNLLRLRRPAFDISILQNDENNDASQNDDVGQKLLSNPTIIDYYKRPASLVDSSAAHTNFKKAIADFNANKYPTLKDALAANSRAEPDYGHGTRTAPKFVVSEETTAFHNSKYSLEGKERRPLLVMIAVFSMITSLVVGFGMILPAWRVGNFQPPFDSEDVRIGLYSVIVPYATSRSTADSEGYSRTQELLFPDSEFEDWTRPPNSEQTVAGLDWDQDDMETFRTAGITSMMFCILSILLFAMTVERFLSRSVTGYTLAIFMKGIAACCSVALYTIIINSISYTETHALLGHDSNYGVSWVLVLVAGVADVLVGSILGMRIASASIAARDSELQAATCLSCHRDISACLCGSGLCKCPGCRPDPQVMAKNLNTESRVEPLNETMLQDLKALPPLEPDANTPLSISRKFSRVTTDSLLQEGRDPLVSSGINPPSVLYVEPKEDVKTPDSPTIERIKTVPSITKLRRVVVAESEVVTPPEVPPTPPPDLNDKLENIIKKEETAKPVSKGTAPPPPTVKPPMFQMPQVPKEQKQTAESKDKDEVVEKTEPTTKPKGPDIVIPAATKPPSFVMPTPASQPNTTTTTKPADQTEKKAENEKVKPAQVAKGPPPPKLPPPVFQKPPSEPSKDASTADSKSNVKVDPKVNQTKGSAGKAPPPPMRPPPSFPMKKETDKEADKKADKVEEKEKNEKQSAEASKKWAPPPPTAPKMFAPSAKGGDEAGKTKKVAAGPPPPRIPPPTFQMKKASLKSLIPERSDTVPVVKQTTPKDEALLDSEQTGVFNYTMAQSESEGSSPRGDTPQAKNDPAPVKRPKLSFKASRPPQILNPDEVLKQQQQEQQQQQQQQEQLDAQHKKEKKGVLGFFKRK